MPEVERFLPGTKVSDWVTPGITARLPTTYVPPTPLAGYICGGYIGSAGIDDVPEDSTISISLGQSVL